MRQNLPLQSLKASVRACFLLLVAVLGGTAQEFDAGDDDDYDRQTIASTSRMPAKTDAEVDLYTAALSVAIDQGNVVLAATLLQRKARPDVDTDDGVPALVHASMNPDREGLILLHALLDGGADVNAESNHGVTALLAAERAGNWRAWEVLLQRGAKEHDHDSATVKSAITRLDAQLLTQSITLGDATGGLVTGPRNLKFVELEAWHSKTFASYPPFIQSAGYDAFGNPYHVRIGASERLVTISALTVKSTEGIRHAPYWEPYVTGEPQAVLSEESRIHKGHGVYTQALRLALDKYDFQLATALVDGGADPETTRTDRTSGLVLASMGNSPLGLQLMKRLIAAGAAVDAARYDGVTALLAAERRGA